MNKIVWVGEPSMPYDKKLKMWPQYTTWPYKIRGDDSTFIMNEDAHEVLLAEEKIKKAFLDLHMGHAAIEPLVKAIEAYGDAREQKGRHEVEENYAEQAAEKDL